MTRLPIAGVATLVFLCSVSTAGAQGAPPPGSLGGGFIEFLATGRSRPAQAMPAYATPPAAHLRQEPVVQVRPGYAPPGHRPPGADLPIRMRQAVVVNPAPQASPVKREIESQFRKQSVAYDGPHKPGTIVIDTRQRYLFLVQEGGTALRYGIGVGRLGFTWSGRKTVSMKREWPDWRPPPEMLKRRPDLPRHMAGGIDNPLGARALYLGSSLYRIHGTNEPHTIGRAVSSGCFRMLNDDVIDLYGRVRVGTLVVVL